MQFPVPQFIDVEDKIIGPFTLKQFGFIFGGGIIILGFFKLLGHGFFFFLLSLPVAIVSLIFAFANYNGRKLYNFIPVFFKFMSANKIMVFQQNGGYEQIDVQPLTTERVRAMTAANQAQAETVQEPMQSRLKRIALQLDQKNAEEIEAINIISKRNG